MKKEVSRIVWVDMDETIFSFDEAALADVPLDERLPKRSFYIAQDYPESLRPLIEAQYMREGFFSSLEMMPGVVDAWLVMHDAGYHPRILSSPLAGHQTCIQEKQQSIRNHLVPHLGKKVLEEAVFDRNKHAYDGLALIDDRPDVLRNGATASWKHILFGWAHFPAPVEVPLAQTALRLVDWSDHDKLMTMLDEIAANR